MYVINLSRKRRSINDHWEQQWPAALFKIPESCSDLGHYIAAFK